MGNKVWGELDENIFLFSSSFYLVKIMKKKRFIRISKRVMVLLLCCSLISGACFDKFKIEAHATAVSVDASAEIMMLLWNFMINGMVVSGSADMVANYEDEKLTFETFMDKLSYEVLNAPDPNECGYVILEDGTKVGLVDVLDGVEDGSIDIPDIGDWGGFRDRSDDDYDDPEDEILKRWDEIDAAWKSKHGSSLPDPSEGPQFSKIQEFLISIGVIEALRDTITDLYDGAIEGLENQSRYNGEQCFSPRGYMSGPTYNLSTHKKLSDNKIIINGAGVIGYPCAAYRNIKYKYDSGLQSYEIILYEYRYDSIVSNVSVYQDVLYMYVDDDSYFGEEINPYVSMGGFIYPSELSESYNFPVFNTRSQMEDYFKTGDDSLAINGKNIDLGVILSCTPEVMNPLVDTKLSPAVLQSTYVNSKSAYQTQIKPQIEAETDIETKTSVYTDIMTETIKDTVAEMATDPDTGTDTTPGTGTEPGTGTQPGTGTGTEPGTDTDADIDINDYKIDLRQVFPFCIPFDFIALLRVLDAEPEAPRFEVPFVVPSVGIDEMYVIDLSMFDDVMEIIRLFELVGFVIGLMLLTGKVIKW